MRYVTRYLQITDTDELSIALADALFNSDDFIYLAIVPDPTTSLSVGPRLVSEQGTDEIL